MDNIISSGSVVIQPNLLSLSNEGFIDVNILQDFLVEGNETVEIILTSATGGSIGPQNSDTVTIQDDDVAGFTLSQTALTTIENGADESFTVVLTAEPSSNVVLSVVPGDESEGTVSPTTLTFTPANWSDTQAVTVTPVDDAVADGPQTYMVTVSV